MRTRLLPRCNARGIRWRVGANNAHAALILRRRKRNAELQLGLCGAVPPPQSRAGAPRSAAPSRAGARRSAVPEPRSTLGDLQIGPWEVPKTRPRPTTEKRVSAFYVCLARLRPVWFASLPARVVELVDTQVSEACAERCNGSSPFPGTISDLQKWMEAGIDSHLTRPPNPRG